LICSTDADCPSGQSCTGSYCPANENICVSTCSEVSASDGGSDAGTCSSAADCASGQSCVAACDSSGSCGSACSTTGSSDGGVCDVQPCTGTGLNLEAFGSDGTCAFICQPDSAPCSSNSDCASGETCFTSPFGGSFCGTGSAALDGGTCSGPADCQGGEVCLYACVGGGCGNLCITQDGSPGAADGGVANNTGYADISVTATAVSASTGASRSICAQLTLQAVGIAPDGSQTPVGDPVTFVSAPSITAAIFGCIVGALDASGNNWGYQVTATSFSTCGSTSGTLGTPISDASPSTVTETVYMDCQLELDVPVDIPVQVSVP